MLSSRLLDSPPRSFEIEDTTAHWGVLQRRYAGLPGAEPRSWADSHEDDAEARGLQVAAEAATLNPSAAQTTEADQ